MVAIMGGSGLNGEICENSLLKNTSEKSVMYVLIEQQGVQPWY